MTKIFAPGARRGSCLLVCCCVLLLTFQIVNSQDRVVARVWGRAIHASEIRPSVSQTAAKRTVLGSIEYKLWLESEAKERLRQRIWCELANGYLQQNRLEPTAEQMKAYAAVSAGRAVMCFDIKGESSDVATLSTFKFDQLLYKKYGGRVVAKGVDWLPVDARRAYLKEARAKRIVEILDSTFSDALTADAAEISSAVIANQNARKYFEQPWWDSVRPEPQRPAGEPFVIKPLGGDGQVRIECANGFSFIVRKAPDNFWYEESKIESDAAVRYKTTREAASIRCSHVSP